MSVTNDEGEKQVNIMSLSLLRQEVRAGGNLELKDAYYTLGGYRLSQDTSTAFKRSLDKGDFRHQLHTMHLIFLSFS